jgi:hypothetical protein
MGELAAPQVFENRVTYRLTEADLASAAAVLRLAWRHRRTLGIDG